MYNIYNKSKLLKFYFLGFFSAVGCCSTYLYSASVGWPEVKHVFEENAEVYNQNCKKYAQALRQYFVDYLFYSKKAGCYSADIISPELPQIAVPLDAIDKVVLDYIDFTVRRCVAINLTKHSGPFELNIKSIKSCYKRAKAKRKYYKYFSYEQRYRYMAALNVQRFSDNFLSKNPQFLYPSAIKRTLIDECEKYKCEFDLATVSVSCSSIEIFTTQIAKTEFLGHFSSEVAMSVLLNNDRIISFLQKIEWFGLSK